MKHNLDSPPILVFLHIPKCAGTTLKTILWQQVLPRKIYTLYEYGNHKERIEQLNYLLKEHRAKLLLIMGHIGYGIHNYLPGNFKYVTMLRDPVKRVISMYHHIRRDKMHIFYNLVKNMTLIEYLESEMDESSSNSQTRFISGIKLEQEINGVDDLIGYGNGTPNQMLERAKLNLKNEIIFGITEQFDKSRLLFSKLLGWRRIYSTRFNSGTYSPSLVTKKEELLIKKYNSLDIELYRYAVEIFNKNILENLPNIEKDLNTFNHKNKILGPLYSYPTRIVYKIIELNGAQ